MGRRRLRTLRKLLGRRTVRVLAALILAPILATLLLRWVPPLFSTLMVQRQVTAWWNGTDYDGRYQWVRLSDISPHAAVAVVAAEDQKFADHWGFDSESIVEALEARQRGGRLRGASTITQQVAKNLFLWPGRSFVRKGLEAGWTILIETLWPKRRTLEVYLNIVELGNGVYGVGAASQRYFGKPASRLTPEEAALLAAVLPNPHRLRVDRPSAYVRERQAWILGQMDQIGGRAYLERLD
jgi:monofunctional biosynthetic peptidoglycan transglycosylase